MWADRLALIEFNHNMHESMAHDQSPFIVTWHYELRIRIKPLGSTIVLVVEDLVNKV